MAEARLTRNPLSIAGAVITTISALAFLLFVALEAFDLLKSPYAGLLGYVLVPGAFLAGLALIPLGMWREGRRRRLGQAAWSWPAVNLGEPVTRRVVAAVGVPWVAQLAMRTDSETSETAWIPFPSAEDVTRAVLGVSGVAGLGVLLALLGLWMMRRSGSGSLAVWLASWAFGPIVLELMQGAADLAESSDYAVTESR